MATLEQRLISLVQALGADMKSHATSIAALAAGGASVKAITVNVPYTTRFSYVTTVLDAALHTNSLVLASFGSTPDTSENDAEELADFSLVVNPIEGALEITLSAPGPMGGPIPIHYLIGA